MSTIELNSIAHDLLAVKAMIAELEGQAEALTDKLKAAMVEQGTETLTGDGWKASWKNVSSSRFDSKSFKESMATSIRSSAKPPQRRASEKTAPRKRHGQQRSRI